MEMLLSYLVLNNYHLQDDKQRAKVCFNLEINGSIQPLFLFP